MYCFSYRFTKSIPQRWKSGLNKGNSLKKHYQQKLICSYKETVRGQDFASVAVNCSTSYKFFLCLLAHHLRNALNCHWKELHSKTLPPELGSTYAHTSLTHIIKRTGFYVNFLIKNLMLIGLLIIRDALDTGHSITGQFIQVVFFDA